MPFEGYDDIYDQNARLAILRCLCEQNDYRLTDSMLDELLLTRYAINRGRSYVRTQIAWLESAAGAVKTENAPPYVFCTLTDAGADHVLRRHVLPGIKRPGAGRN